MGKFFAVAHAEAKPVGTIDVQKKYLGQQIFSPREYTSHDSCELIIL